MQNPRNLVGRQCGVTPRLWASTLSPRFWRSMLLLSALVLIAPSTSSGGTIHVPGVKGRPKAASDGRLKSRHLKERICQLGF